MRILGVIIGTLLVGACTVAPPSGVSPIDIPDHYAESGQWISAAPSDEAPKGMWWQQFGDPTLNALQSSLPEVNPSLKIAVARLDEAKAISQAAAAAFWPKVSIGVSQLKARTSSESPNFSPTRANPLEDFSANASISYELDLFGRIRSGANSARALALAAGADVLAVELSLRAELTNEYFLLRALDAQWAVLEETLRTDTEALRVMERLWEGGVATASDVALSKAQLESVRTQLSDTRIRRAQAEHAIAVLLGRPPAEWRLPPSPLDRSFTAPAVSPGLPSSLLQRRPDVAAAQRRVESARAQVGLARSAYFPVFSIGATLGRDSARSANWFTAPARFWSIAPAAAVTLFDGGQRRAYSRGAVAYLEEMTESYRRTVLTAFGEVEDQLAALRELHEARQSAANNVESSLAAYAQSRHRLDAGAITYIELATAQNALLSARLSEISILQRQIAATTLLMRAVGGNWQD